MLLLLLLPHQSHDAGADARRVGGVGGDRRVERGDVGEEVQHARLHLGGAVAERGEVF